MIKAIEFKLFINRKPMKRAYVFFADGFEELEAIGTVDMLRRAGMDAVSVSVNGSQYVTGAHNVTVKTDIPISEVDAENAEWLVLPGGMPGAVNLYDCAELQALLRSQYDRNRNIAAICASPAVVLGQLGMLKGRKATCYPGFEGKCEGAEMKDERCVTDANIVTANGPSSVTNMCFAIISISKGRETAVRVMNDMLIYPKEQPYFF